MPGNTSREAAGGRHGYQDLLVEHHSGVLTITLNRPEKLNALTWRSWRELEAVLSYAVDDDAVRAIVLTGAGRGFCSGTDLTAAAGEETAPPTRTEMTRPRYASILAIAGCRKPTIAAVNGVVAGAGLSLALACDIRIASESARFHALWSKRALVPDLGATMLLPDLIGPSRALDLFYSGEGISAAEAQALGIVNRVLPPEQLLEETQRYATQVASGPSVALELTKHLVNHRRLAALTEQIRLEEANQAICRETEDAIEGRRSFMEKRPARFIGR